MQLRAITRALTRAQALVEYERDPTKWRNTALSYAISLAAKLSTPLANPYLPAKFQRMLLIDIQDAIREIKPLNNYTKLRLAEKMADKRATSKKLTPAYFGDIYHEIPDEARWEAYYLLTRAIELNNTTQPVTIS